MLRGSRCTPWTRAVAALCALALLMTPALARAQAADATLGAESPQAVVERMKAASEDEDLGTMAALMAPDDRAVLSLTMVTMLGMVMAFAQMGGEMAAGMAEGMSEDVSAEEKAAAEKERKEALDAIAALETKYEALLQQYELADVLDQDLGPDTDPVVLMADVDQVALLRDLTKLLDELPGEEESEASGPVDMPVGELTSLEIDGDRATGMLGDEPVSFVRIDGRWYVDLGLEEEMKQGMGGMGTPPGGSR